MAGMKRWLFTAATGAALQYFLDPDRGRTRRVKAKDQALAAARRAGRQLENRREDARNRAQGLGHELSRPHGEAPDDDRTLVDKVRSEVLGRAEYHDAAINVDAVDGVVTLRGQLQTPEQIRALRSAVAEIPGVREVESYLHLPGTPAPNKHDVRNIHVS